jgi:AcrR family transcriptional regulator
VTSTHVALEPPLLPDIAVPAGSRSRILEAGLVLFAQRGYYGTSIRDIAAAAGLQSASLYTHFSSKESILAELVRIGHEAHHRALTLALMECGSDAVAQLRAMVEAHVGAHADFPVLGVVVNHELMHLSPEAAAPAVALRDQSLTLFIAVVERGMAAGVFEVPQPDVIMTAITTMGSSVAVWYPTRRHDISRETLCRSYADLAVRMVERHA